MAPDIALCSIFEPSITQAIETDAKLHSSHCSTITKSYKDIAMSRKVTWMAINDSQKHNGHTTLHTLKIKLRKAFHRNFPVHSTVIPVQPKKNKIHLAEMTKPRTACSSTKAANDSETRNTSTRIGRFWLLA